MKQAISALILLFIAALIALNLINDTTVLTSEQNTTKAATDTEKPVKQLSAKEKKKRFIDKTLPAIQRVKSELDSQFNLIWNLSKKAELTPAEQATIESLKIYYGVDGVPCLLNRLKTHPVSIILAQAALETGWGTSRFYNEANNIFGIWSYNPNEPRLAASETRGAKTIYVKKYPDLDASIEGYFKMMASGHAYKGFRKARLSEENPFKLIAHLTHYSELREEYVKRLYSVIKSNRFYRYDDPVYQPISLKQVLPEYYARKAAADANASTAAKPAAVKPAPAGHTIETPDTAECAENAESDKKRTEG